MANLGRRSGISEAPVQTSKVNPAGQGPALLALSRVRDKGAWGPWSTKEPGTYSEACECFNVLPFPASLTKRYLALVGQDREGSEEIKGAVTGVGQYFQATLGKEEEGLGGLAIPCCDVMRSARMHPVNSAHTEGSPSLSTPRVCTCLRSDFWVPTSERQ